MKKILLLFLILMTFSSCTKREVEKDAPIKERELSFNVESQSLATGNYDLNSNIKFLEKSADNSQFLLSAGAVESDNVKIDKITLINDSLNFYTSAYENKEAVKVHIPQITVNVNLPKEVDYNKLKLNMIKSNYENIKLNYSADQAINTIKSNYGIDNKVSPKVRLQKQGDSYFWEVFFESAFISNDSTSPLLQVSSTVDSSTGEVTSFNKKIISEMMGSGYINDFNSSSNRIVYSREDESGHSTELYVKDLNDNTEKKVFTFKGNLKDTALSKDSDYLAILQQEDTYKLLVKDLNTDSLKEVYFSGIPKDIVWYEDSLYLSSKVDSETSKILKYDVETNEFLPVVSFKGEVSSFAVKESKISYCVEDVENKKKSIYLYENGITTFLTVGFNPLFTDKDSIIFLSDSDNLAKTNILEYDLTSKTTSALLFDQSISKVFYSENFIYLVAENETGLFQLNSYNVLSKKYLNLFTFTDENISFNFNTNQIYFSTTTSSDGKRRIYFLTIPMES